MRLFLTAWLLCLSAVAVAEEAIEDRQTELEGVRGRIQDLREEIKGVTSRRLAEEEALRVLETEIGSISLRMRRIEAERAESAGRLEQLKTERTEADRDLEGQRARLASTFRASYAMGRQQELKLLLSQDDPARFNRVLTYYGYLQRRRMQRIGEIRDTLQRIDRSKDRIREEEAHFNTLLASLDQAQSRLLGAEADRRRLLTELDADIKQRGTEVSRLEEDEARLKALIERLKQQQARQQARALASPPPPAADAVAAFGQRKGQLQWPASGALRTAFGAPKSGGLAWDGALIGAAAGDVVRAVHRGRVVFADWLKGYGLLMIIDHGDGYMSLYGYNQSLLKADGDWVEAGEEVAIVGTSGGRTEPALYFGIRHGGRPVDPARWCRGGPAKHAG